MAQLKFSKAQENGGGVEVMESLELLGFSHPLRLSIVVAISNGDV